MTRFQKLVLATIAVSFVLIVLGGVVRITGAGMGCGDDWPICNGRVVPRFSYLTALEYAHRMVAGTLTVLTVSLIVTSWRAVRRERRLVQLSVLALLLVLLQAGLGAGAVFLELEPVVVTAHLGLAETYFATMLLLGLLAFRERLSPGGRPLQFQAGSGAGRAAAFAALAVLVLMLSGAYVATTNASYACPEWPLCGANYAPTGWSPTDVHLLHRWLALLAAVAVGITLQRTWRLRRDLPGLGRLAAAAAGLMLVEILIGGANIWFELAPVVRALHLAMATVVWGLLVTIALVDRLFPASIDAGLPRARLDARREPQPGPSAG